MDFKEIGSKHGAKAQKSAVQTGMSCLRLQLDGVCWPRDILSKDIKQIRIITWGYDSSVVNAFAGSSQASIFGHSEDLLTDIASPRLRTGAVRVSHEPQGASRCTKR
jgi:hypothetical protein